MKILNNSSQCIFIKQIIVRKLFGHFNYNLDLDREDVNSANKLAILYGNNGSGKTTLLKLLFHLLSPVDNRGHKSVVSNTKFQSFEVYLSDGTKIIAERPKKQIAGDIEIKIEKTDSGTISVPIKVQNGVVTPESVDPTKVKKFLRKLEELQVEILFMRDNRRLTSNFDEKTHATDADVMLQVDTFFDEIARKNAHRMHGQIKSPLGQAIDDVTIYFQQRALSASSKGEIDTNNIYDEIIKHLVRPGKRTSDYSDNMFEEYMAKFEALAERNQSFVKIGLASPLMAKDMIKSLVEAQSQTRPALMNVLKPFIDSVQARLDALESIRHLIYQFIDSLNSFFGSDKKVIFNLENGLHIVGYDGDMLEPQSLSSGEKQLLAMFCHIVCVKGGNTIFIIDEPELSLNVKWQRRIVQSLLDCTQGASVQFIMASHSLELLARHRSHVVQLENNE